MGMGVGYSPATAMADRQTLAGLAGSMYTLIGRFRHGGHFGILPEVAD